MYIIPINIQNGLKQLIVSHASFFCCSTTPFFLFYQLLLMAWFGWWREKSIEPIFMWWSWCSSLFWIITKRKWLNWIEKTKSAYLILHRNWSINILFKAVLLIGQQLLKNCLENPLTTLRKTTLMINGQLRTIQMLTIL